MESAKIEARHVDIDGARLAYWTTGSGSTLLVLHGGPGLGSSYLRAPLAALLGGADLGDWDLHGDLSGIAAPALIMAGAESIFPLEAVDAIDRQMRDSRLVILDGVGHFPFLEAPERFAREVDRFLR